jgi:hypothetical protein
MFRFLYTVDLHLDSPLRSSAAKSGTGAKTLLGANLTAFDALFDLAIAGHKREF